VNDSHQLLITCHGSSRHPEFFWLRNAISAEIILIQSIFKHDPAARTHGCRNGRKSVHTIRTAKRGQQPVGFWKRVSNFSRGIWPAFNSAPCCGGFKNPAAYQAFRGEHRIKENIQK
jgi:hypothetical protein